MSKLKQAIDKKDWITAKRLMMDNPKYLEENVDFVLGMIQELDELVPIWRRKDKQIITPTPWIMGPDTFKTFADICENYKEPSEDLDYARNYLMNQHKPGRYEQQCMGVWENHPEDELSISEKIDKRQTEMFNEMTEHPLDVKILCPDGEAKEFIGMYPDEIFKELAHEQAIRINEKKTDNQLDGFWDGELKKNGFPDVKERRIIGGYGVDMASPEGDKNSAVLKNTKTGEVLVNFDDINFKVNNSKEATVGCDRLELWSNLYDKVESFLKNYQHCKIYNISLNKFEEAIVARFKTDSYLNYFDMALENEIGDSFQVILKLEDYAVIKEKIVCNYILNIVGK